MGWGNSASTHPHKDEKWVAASKFCLEKRENGSEGVQIPSLHQLKAFYHTVAQISLFTSGLFYDTFHVSVGSLVVKC
jgi:hypothetical protein